MHCLRCVLGLCHSEWFVSCFSCQYLLLSDSRQLLRWLVHISESLQPSQACVQERCKVTTCHTYHNT